MSKIFRLHSGAPDTIEGWQNVNNHLHENFIKSIEDPAGSTSLSQITSIPTPFARMDLVRTAFRFITGRKELDGNTIYHKLVSDCLDVAQIFFNIEALKDKIEIYEWKSGITQNGGELAIDATSDLGALLSNANAKHLLLGETLKMFLVQDAKAFNFSDLKNIYLLNYKLGPKEINIIGGTSPATLFFSSANDLSGVDITFGNDRVFDSSFCPLFKRNQEFIKYIFSFRHSFPAFAEKFPDIELYLEQTFSQLTDSLKAEIIGLQDNFFESSFNVIDVQAEGNCAEILNFKLRCKKYNLRPLKEDYDFIIDATYEVEELLPLALPKEPFNEPLRYAGGTWQQNYHQSVPYLDPRPLLERTLPNQSHIKYPFLTVSDLLEPYIIKLPFPIDKKRFFDGNLTPNDKEREINFSFALPIKRKFFEYFSIDDLGGTVSDGKKVFELIEMGGGVKAVLRIPIKGGGYINYSRLYALNQFKDRVSQADEADNSGIIIENQFTIGIYPFVKLPEEVNPHYRIAFVDRDISPITKHLSYSVNFFKASRPNNSLNVTQKIRSKKSQAQGATSMYYVLENGFDLIEVSHSIGSGILIPIFEPLPTSTKAFKFAIDFGTTNTHIEYKETKSGGDGSKERAFDITEKDVQLGTLHLADEKTEALLSNTSLGFGATLLLDIIKIEFLPHLINKDSQYKFPQRTVINDNDGVNPDEPNFALADYNIPFWYLKETINRNSEITPNLKWSNFNEKKLERRTRAFIKQLMIMIRNKVIMNGGNLEATQIVWFYPSSMPKFRRGFLQQSWDIYYERYFGPSKNIHSLSESLAPFCYLRAKAGITAMDKPVACVDIGGGTSDIVIYKENQPHVATSFRFASNALFGDGYGNSVQNNGFVLRFEKQILESLGNTDAKSLVDVYNNLHENNSKSLELLEFFFSLEDNKEIKDNKIPLSFSKLLSNDTEMKVVFLFYYAAIIFHLAKLMKVKGLEPPRYITFTGNGSKIIKIVAGTSNLDSLTQFTRVVFADVFQLNQQPNIDLQLFDNPKEITCKGGLECDNFKALNTIEDQIDTVLVGNGKNYLIPTDTISYTQIKEETLIDSVCAEVNAFIDRFFDWNAQMNYYNNFGISSKKFNDYKSYLKEDLRAFLLTGINEKLTNAESDLDGNIEETLFFYPLVGAINKLAYKIQVSSSTSN